MSLLTTLLSQIPPEFDEQQIKGVRTHILSNDPPQKRITPICLPPAPVPKAKTKLKPKKSSAGRKPVAQKRVLDYLRIKKSGEATVKDLNESDLDICHKDSYGMLRRMEKNGLIEITTGSRPLVVRITALGRTSLL